MRDLWLQVEKSKGAGLSAQGAALRVDLRAHASRFPQLATVGFAPLAVERIYRLIDERAGSSK